MQPDTDARGSRPGSFWDRETQRPRVAQTMSRTSGERYGAFRLGVRFLSLAVLGLVLGGLTPLRAQAPRTLRVTGTIQRIECDCRGVELWPLRPRLSFEAEIDERGRWRISGAYRLRPANEPAGVEFDESGRPMMTRPTEPGAERYEQGFDGSNTYVVHRGLEGVIFRDKSGNPIVPQPERTLANILPGNEFPFRAGAWSHLDWFVLASFNYQQRPEKAGHVPSLLGPDPGGFLDLGVGMTDSCIDVDPLSHALKVRSTFRAEWPRFVEQAEFFLDPLGIPKQPIGFLIPTDASMAQTIDSRLKSLQARSPGARVGRLTSSEPRTFDGRVFPTRYCLEMTWRFTGRPVDPSALDKPMTRFVLKIDKVQESSEGVGRPRLPVTSVEVFDHRFRRVVDDSVTQFLGYSVDDGRWRSEHEFGLRISAALEHLQRRKIVRVGDPAVSIY